MTSHPRGARGLRRLRLSIALALAASGAAQAGETDYWMDMSYLHSNNINQSENNQAAESVLIPRLAFDISEEGSRITLHALGQIEYRDYVHNKYPNEFRNSFSGQFNWAMVPDRANLVLEDYLSNQPISLRVGNYPGNEQRVNVFIGGPSFFARMGEATRAQLDLRATDTSAEVTRDFDSMRYSAAGKLQRDLTQTQQLSLNAVHTRVNFDRGSTAYDFTRNDAFVGYRKTFPNSNLELDAGYSRIRRHDGSASFSLPLLNAEFRWQSGRNQITVHARRRFSDTMQDLVTRNLELDDPVIPDLAESTLLVDPQVYRQLFFDVNYRYRSERWSVRIRPEYGRVRYLDNKRNDRNFSGAYFQADYLLRPRLQLELTGLLRNRNFIRDRRDRDRIYSLGVEYRMTRHWSAAAAFYRNTRGSSEPDPVYTEDSVRFTVAWHR